MESKTNFTLKKGDPCRVRLHNGRVVEAIYDEASPYMGKAHRVIVGDMTLIAIEDVSHRYYCRFVGPSCDLVPL